MMRNGQVGASPASVRHFVGLPQIVGDSERCSVRTYVILFSLDAAGRVQVPFVGSYADTCVKTDAGWLFQKRVIAADLGGFRGPEERAAQSR
jgi:hypothetical protein